MNNKLLRKISVLLLSLTMVMSTMNLSFALEGQTDNQAGSQTESTQVEDISGGETEVAEEPAAKEPAKSANGSGSELAVPAETGGEELPAVDSKEAPTKKNGTFTYNGSEQVIYNIKAIATPSSYTSSATGFVYRLGETGDWNYYTSANSFKIKNAGTYELYYKKVSVTRTGNKTSGYKWDLANATDLTQVGGPVKATINPLDISGSSITLSQDTFTYNGDNLVGPTLDNISSIKYGNSNLEKTSFTLSDNQANTLGEHTLTATANEGSNYTGNLTKKWYVKTNASLSVKDGEINFYLGRTVDKSVFEEVFAAIIKDDSVLPKNGDGEFYYDDNLYTIEYLAHKRTGTKDNDIWNELNNNSTTNERHKFGAGLTGTDPATETVRIIFNGSNEYYSIGDPQTATITCVDKRGPSEVKLNTSPKIAWYAGKSVPSNINQIVYDAIVNKTGSTPQAGDYDKNKYTIEYLSSDNNTWNDLNSNSTSDGRHKFGAGMTGTDPATETVRISYAGDSTHKPSEAAQVVVTLVDGRKNLVIEKTANTDTFDFNYNDVEYNGISDNTKLRQAIYDTVIKSAKLQSADSDLEFSDVASWKVTYVYNEEGDTAEPTVQNNVFGQKGKKLVTISFSINSAYKDIYKPQDITVTLKVDDLRSKLTLVKKTAESGKYVLPYYEGKYYEGQDDVLVDDIKQLIVDGITLPNAEKTTSQVTADGDVDSAGKEPTAEDILDTVKIEYEKSNGKFETPSVTDKNFGDGESENIRITLTIASDYQKDYQPTVEEFTLYTEDPRDDFDITLKSNPSVVLYEDEDVNESVYRRVFNALVENSDVEYSKEYYDIQFASKYQETQGCQTTDKEEFVTLKSNHTKSFDTSEGSNFGDNDSEKVRIIFKGNDEYKPWTSETDCPEDILLDIKPEEDNRDTPELTLKEGVTVNLFTGESITPQIIEKVFKAIIDDNPTEGEYDAGLYSVEFLSNTLRGDSWVALDKRHDSLVAHRFGSGNTSEKVRVQFFGTDPNPETGDKGLKYKQSNEVTLNINYINPSITLKDIIEVDYTAATMLTSDTQKEVDYALGKIQGEIYGAIDQDSVIPEDFLEGAKIVYHFRSARPVNGWEELTYVPSLIDWLTHHKFGQSFLADELLEKLRGSASTEEVIQTLLNREIELGNTETVRITVTNPNHPGIKVQAESTAKLSDQRIPTKINWEDVKTVYNHNLKDDVLEKITVQPDVDDTTGLPEFSYDEDEDITIEPTYLDASQNAQTVTVKYAGNTYYQPCKAEVTVYVDRADASIDVKTYTKKYNGKPVTAKEYTEEIIETSFEPNPEVPNRGIDYVYVTLGLDSQVSGFINIDIPQSTKDALDFSKQTQAEIESRLSKYMSAERAAELAKAIADEMARIAKETTGYTSLYDYISDLINRREGLTLTGLKAAIKDIEKVLGTSVLGEGTFGSLIGIDEEAFDKLLAELDKYAIGNGVKFKLGQGPKDAGLYVTIAALVDKNYKFDIDAANMTIFRQGWSEEDNISLAFKKAFDGSQWTDEYLTKEEREQVSFEKVIAEIERLKWLTPEQVEELGLNKIGDYAKARTITIDMAQDMLEDKEWGGKLMGPDSEGNIKEIVDLYDNEGAQARVHAIYVGVKADGGAVLTRDEAPTKPGLYSETVYVILGNYIAMPITRVFRIQKHPANLNWMTELSEYNEGKTVTLSDEEQDAIDLAKVVGLDKLAEYGITSYEKVKQAVAIPVSEVKAGNFDFTAFFSKKSDDTNTNLDPEGKLGINENIHTLFVGMDYEGNTYLKEAAPTAAGVYTEIAYALKGDYKAKPIIRTFVIQRAATKIDLSLGEQTGNTFEKVYDTKQAVITGELINKLTGNAVSDSATPIEVKYIGYQDRETGLYTSKAPTDAGMYLVRATFAGDADYLPSDEDAILTIKQVPFNNLTINVDDWYYGNTASEIKVDTDYAGTAPQEIEYAIDAPILRWFYSEKTPTEAGKYRVRVTIPETRNYEGGVAYDSFEIMPRPVDVNWIGPDTFEYDSKKHAPEAEIVKAKGVEGIDFAVVPGDKIYLDVSGEKENVGNYTATCKLAGSDKNNYVLVKDAKTSYDFSITKRKIKLGWGETEFVYNGKLQRPTCAADRLILGDLVWLDTDVNKLFYRDAGDYTITAKLIGLDASNYEIINEKTISFTISPRPISINWEDTDFTYNSLNQKPRLAITNDGTHIPAVIFGDLLGAVAVVDKDGNLTSNYSDAGEYTAHAVLVGPSRHNYVIVDEAKTKPYEIKQAELSVELGNISRVYGEITSTTENPKFDDLEITINGLFGKDEATVTPYVVEETKDEEPTMALLGESEDTVEDTVETESNYPKVGNYPIKANVDYNENNYKLVSVKEGNLEITRRPIAVQWTKKSVFDYTGKEQGPDATIVPYGGYDPAIVSIDGELDDIALLIKGHEVKPGTYTATSEIIGEDAYNYYIVEPDKEFTILEPDDVNTGDENDAAPYVLFALMSLMGMAVIATKRRKED